MRVMSYNVRRVASLITALAFAFGISYLGQPPPRATVKKEIPLELHRRDKSGYNSRDFAIMEFYMPGYGVPLCRIPSTTVVRKYFDKSGEYAERTRLDKEVCQLPPDTSNLDIKVTFPYKPEDSIEHTLDSCSSFSKKPNGWQAACIIEMNGEIRNVSLTAYEQRLYQPNPNLDHQRRADRIDVLLLK